MDCLLREKDVMLTEVLRLLRQMDQAEMSAVIRWIRENKEGKKWTGEN